MSRKKCLLYPKKILIIFFLNHSMKNLNSSLSKLCIIEMNIPSKGIFGIKSFFSKKKELIMILAMNQLRVFYAAAKSRSITRTADELMVTPPTITMQIKQLEKAMSIRFLVRNGNTIHLTNTGEAVFARAEKNLPLDSRNGRLF